MAKLIATTAAKFVVSAAFKDKGVLSAAAYQGAALTPTFHSIGRLTATDKPKLAAAFRGTGVLSVVAYDRKRPLSGTGRLTATIVPTLPGAFHGTGKVTAIALPGIPAPLSGKGSLTIAFHQKEVRAAALSGSGALTAIIKSTSTPAFHGTGTLTATIVPTLPAALHSVGRLTANIKPKITAPLHSVGTLTATIKPKPLAFLSGHGALTATALSSGAVFAGHGGLSAAVAALITFDAVGSGNNAVSGTTLSWTHTAVNPDTYVLAWVSNDGNQTISICTYGGVIMTPLFSVPYNNDLTLASGSLYLFGSSATPAAGAQTITVTFNGITVACGNSVSYRSGATIYVSAPPTNTYGLSTNPSQVMRYAPGQAIVQGFGSQTKAFTASSGALQRYNGTSSTGRGNLLIMDSAATAAAPFPATFPFTLFGPVLPSPVTFSTTMLSSRWGAIDVILYGLTDPAPVLPHLPGAGALTITFAQKEIRPAALLGSGVLSAKTVQKEVRAAAFHSAGSLTGTIGATPHSSAAFHSAGSLTIAFHQKEVRHTALSGTGSLTATATVSHVSYLVDFSTLPSGTFAAEAPMFTTTWSGAGNASLSITHSTGAVWNTANNSHDNSVTGVYNALGWNGNFGITVTDYQTMTGVITGLPGGLGSGQAASNYGIVRYKDANNYVYGRVNLNSSIIAELGCVVGGVRTVLSTASFTFAQNLSIVAGVAGNPYRFQLTAGGTVYLDYTDNAHVSQVGAAYRGWGFISDTDTSSGSNAPANAVSCGCFDNP